MERAGLKILNTAASPLHFRAKTSIFRPFLLPKVEHNLHFPLLASSSLLSSLHSLCIRSDANTLSNGDEVPTAQNKLLQVVLVSPQIPGNTGSIARTCAASAVGLHLVEPLGFPIDNTKLKRAGLDYWPYVVVKVHRSWDEFREYFMEQAGEKRLLAFTKRGTVTHSDFSYKKGDWLVFGSETKGLPAEALLDCKSESLGGGTLRIPMVETYVRCLNLSVLLALQWLNRPFWHRHVMCMLLDTCM